MKRWNRVDNHRARPVKNLHRIPRLLNPSQPVQTSTEANCPSCDLLHHRPVIRTDQVANCARCGETIATGRPGLSGSNCVSLSATALIFWLLALWFPISKVEKLGLTNQGRLLEIGQSFRNNDQLILGTLADLFAVALPSALFCLLPVIALARLFDGTFPGHNLALKICSYAKQWAMPDVLLLSILVAFIKLGSLAEASISIGFYFLFAAVFLQTYLLQRMRLKDFHRQKNKSTAWALMISALVLLIPANALPIMTITTTSDAHHSNIIQGVATLVQSGFWFIAAIVFVASILVPFSKLGGLFWLLRLSQKRAGTLNAARIYRALEFIGKWSMLDIFLIGVLAILIDFGKLASIKAGPAAPVFAIAVILTAMAVERFDLRSLFTQTEPTLTK